MSWAYGDTITVIRQTPGTINDLGQEVPGEPNEFDIHNCAVSPSAGVGGAASSQEDVYARDVLTHKALVYMTADAPAVLATDRVRYRGQEYAVDGSPAEWHSPLTGWYPGRQISLLRVRGAGVLND